MIAVSGSSNHFWVITKVKKINFAWKLEILELLFMYVVFRLGRVEQLV